MGEQGGRIRQRRWTKVVVGALVVGATIVAAFPAASAGDQTATITLDLEEGINEVTDLPNFDLIGVLGADPTSLTICQGQVFTRDWSHSVETQGESVHLTHENAEGSMYLELHSDGTIHWIDWTLDSTQDEWRVWGSQDHGGFESSWFWNGIAMAHEGSLGININETSQGCDVVSVWGDLGGRPLTTRDVANVTASGELCNADYQPEKCTV